VSSGDNIRGKHRDCLYPASSRRIAQAGRLNTSVLIWRYIDGAIERKRVSDIRPWHVRFAAREMST